MADVPIDDDLSDRAAAKARTTGRTTGDQINYWVRLGIEAELALSSGSEPGC